MKENWTYKKLGEIAKISSGKAIPSCEISETLSDGFYPCYGGNGLRGYVDHYSHVGLTPVIGRVGALCGNVHLPQDKFYATEHALVVILKTNDKPHFIEYILGSLNLRQYAKGVAQPVLSASSLSDIPIPIPPMEEQERIVAELDLLQSVIDKKKAQLDEYDKLAQSIFYEMFGDPIDNPKKWEVKKLGEVGTIIAGSTPSTNDDSNWDGEVNWVTPAELGEQLFYGETKRKLTEKGAKGLTMMPVGTVLLSSRAPIGKLAITTVPMCCNQGFKNIICSESINNIFLYFYLMQTMDFVQALGRGVIFKEVSKNAISTYKVCLPPLSLQQSFAEKIEAIEHQKELVKQSLNEVKTLFDSRMDYYFN